MALALVVPVSAANMPFTAGSDVVQLPGQHSLVNQVHAADSSAVSTCSLSLLNDGLSPMAKPRQQLFHFCRTVFPYQSVSGPSQVPLGRSFRNPVLPRHKRRNRSEAVAVSKQSQRMFPTS